MKKIFILVFLLLCSLFLVGCWDAREINTLFIVTGIAIDKSEQEGFFDVSVIGIKTSPSRGGSQSSDDKDKKIVLKTTTRSIRDAFFHLNLNYDRTLYLQHNQIVIFGEDVAKDDLHRHLEFFVRSENSRMETLMLIVEGRADEVFKMDVKQEQNSTIYLFTHIQTISRRVKHYKISVLNFIANLLTEGFHSVIPIFAVNKNDDDDMPINMTGFAVFRNNKMIAKITDLEALGFVLLKGDVKNTNRTIISYDGMVSFDFDDIKTKKEIIYKDNYPIKIKITIEITARVEELLGFEKYSIQDLNRELHNIVQQEIINVATQTFKYFQELKVDVFGIGLSFYQHHPKKWNNLRNDWDNIFASLEVEINPKVVIKDYGQIVSIYNPGGVK